MKISDARCLSSKKYQRDEIAHVGYVMLDVTNDAEFWREAVRNIKPAVDTYNGEDWFPTCPFCGSEESCYAESITKHPETCAWRIANEIERR